MEHWKQESCWKGFSLKLTLGAGHVAQLAQGPGNWRQETQKSKVIFGYASDLKPTWIA